jgi:hypothetical protein
MCSYVRTVPTFFYSSSCREANHQPFSFFSLFYPSAPSRSRKSQGKAPASRGPRHEFRQGKNNHHMLVDHPQTTASPCQRGPQHTRQIAKHTTGSLTMIERRTHPSRHHQKPTPPLLPHCLIRSTPTNASIRGLLWPRGIPRHIPATLNHRPYTPRLLQDSLRDQVLREYHFRR